MVTTAGTSGAGTYRSAWSSRTLRWLLGAFALSSLGQTIGSVAVTVVVYDRTGSATWAAVAAAARLVPYLLCSGLAGVLADRCDRRKLLVRSASVRVVFALASLVAVVASAPVWLLIGLTFALTAAGTPCYPTMAAVVPDVVDDGDLIPANGLVTTVEAGSFLIGPALGGLLLVAGPAAVLVVDALVLASAGLALRPVPALPAPGRASAETALRHELSAGLRTITGSAAVARPLLLAACVNLVYGASLVLLLLVADDLMAREGVGYGVLTAAFGAGALAGVLLTNRLGQGRRSGTVLAAATLLAGVPFALLVAVRTPVGAAVLLVVAGVASVVAEVVAVTMLQRAVPPAVLARVFGAFDAVVVGAILAGSAMTPSMVRLLGLEGTLLVVGLGVPGLAVAAAALLRSTPAEAPQPVVTGGRACGS